jgi:transposase
VNYIAIDLGSRKSQVCIRDQTGEITGEERFETAALISFLSRHEPAHVVMETCSEAFAIAIKAIAAGHRCTVVPASQVRFLGVGARGVKTDARDARVLSEAIWRGRVPSVHVPSPRALAWRRMLSTRELLVITRTRLTNATRGYLRTHLLSLPKRSATFAQAVRTLFVTAGHVAPPCIERQLALLEIVNAQLAEADAECTAIAKADALCSRLMTVPGVGPFTALNFVAAVDDVSRFRDAHAVQAYLGLVPGEASSGSTIRRTRITKAGASRVRKCLNQAAWGAYRMRPLSPHGAWMHQLAQRRGKKIAVTALARRLAGVLYALWRDEREYVPELAVAKTANESRTVRVM